MKAKDADGPNFHCFGVVWKSLVQVAVTCEWFYIYTPLYIYTLIHTYTWNL